GEVHLDERRDLEAARRRLRVARVAELADAVDDLRLPALQVADEVPAEGVAVGRVLRLQVLRAVLADDLYAGLGQNGHLLERHVLRRGDHGHAWADLCANLRVPLADLVRRYGRSRPGLRGASRRDGTRRRAPGGTRCRRRGARPTRTR